jgi:hypothetical protein
MRLLKDPERHKALERWLADKLVGDIKATLEAASIKDGLLKQLTTELALGVAAKWEGVPPNILELNLGEAAPFLVFGVNNDNEDVLVRNYDEMGSFLSKETQAALARAFEA